MQIELTPIFSGEEKLLQLLLQKNILSETDLRKIKTQAALFKQTLFQYMLQYRFIDPEKLMHVCSDFFQLPMIALENKKITDLQCQNVPFQIIKNNFLLPIEKNKKNLIIAISHPDDLTITKTLSFQLGLSIDLRFARYDSLCRLHNALTSEQQYLNLQDKNDHLVQLMTHQLLSDAIHRSASDIHFEPYQHRLRVRFRIDGLLHDIISIPTHLTDEITSCIKVLSNLDIAIKRMPQDGRLAFRSYLGFFKDCRVSTCPTIHGEKIVIRLLDVNTQIRPIEALGLNAKNQKIIFQSIRQPQGLILVTGPTGSGKTITLYTLLNLLNEQHRNITTIEDPVEMHMEGINQTHVNTKTGLTFSHTLRTLLRQDPDVIMIGEIRDQETAEMAIRAAQTGHLVLSTLHTNSAAEAITRLCHMGIAPFHLASALTLVIAQRLVRQLCAYCKTPQLLPPKILNDAGISELSLMSFEAHSCTHCNHGFQGRLGIFELMPVTVAIKQFIFDHASSMALTKQNQLDGQMNLWQSALEMVQSGLTSLSEIYRVVPNHA